LALVEEEGEEGGEDALKDRLTQEVGGVYVSVESTEHRDV
jgi:hypothetical protein